MFHCKPFFRAGICLLLFALSGVGLAQSEEQKEPTSGEIAGNRIVRVFFEDLTLAYELAAGFEPMESDYDKGYLVFHLNPDEYKAMLEIAADRGFYVETDEALTDYYESLAQQPPIPTEAVAGYPCYRTVEETFATAQALVAARPDLASWIDIGDSWEKTMGLGGYDMMVLKLTNSAVAGPKPKFIATSAIHAREYTTAELATRFAEYLVSNHGVDADATWILDYHEVHLILQTNPDGRKMAETGILWRKNTNQDYCGPTSSDRGADLNRNFPFQWGCCGGSSGSECSTTFRGAAPESEPELQAVTQYLRQEFPDQRGPNLSDPSPHDVSGVYLDIHSSGQLVLYSWGFTASAAPNPELATMGRKLAYINDHVPGPGTSLYVTDGSSKDFGYGELGVPSLVFELGTQFFEQCSVFEDLVLAKNLPALIHTAKMARAPFINASGPDTLNLRLSAGFTPDLAVPAGALVDIEALLDGSRYNNVDGVEPTQAAVGAEFTIDTPPWEAGASPTGMTAADGAFNSVAERVQGVIDTTGLSDGRHTVYVHGSDGSGDFGAVSAIFLYVDSASVVPITLFQDDFESDLGWTDNPNGIDTATTGQWARANPEGTESTGGNSTGPKQLDLTAEGDFALVTGASAGSSVGTNDIDNGVTSIRSPDIALTPGVVYPTLSFSYYLAHTTNASSDDFLRVTVVGPSGSQVVLEELGAAADDDGEYERADIDLSAFSGQTIHLLVEAADAGGGSIVEASVDDLRIIGLSTGANAAPYVNAGPDQAVSLAADAALDGTVNDDGLPNPPGATAVTWSQVSGPGVATFANANAVDTTVGFSAAGVYTLRLTADDGDLTSSDDVEIDVSETALFTELAFDDFESGWGSYNDGGSDCRRSANDSGYAHQGTYCVRIRDNSGTASSFYSNGIDLSGYSEFKIEFWYVANSMENGEDFFVEFWNGSSWQIVASYAAGAEFVNGPFYNPEITLDSGVYNFSANAQVRFRCDASGNADRIFIDEVKLSAR